jgi:hypothetical protein
MMRIDTLGCYRRFVTPSIVSLAIMAFVAVSWTSRGASSTGGNLQVQKRIRKDLIAATELKTATRVAGLEVTRLEKQLEEGHISVWLRNVSGKAITGYEVAIGIGTVQVDLLTADEPHLLPPGGVTRDKYGIQAELETRGVTVLAAIFEDGTTDGEPNAVQDINQYRLGVKIQSDHSVKLLRTLAALSDSEFASEAKRIRSKLPALSAAEEDGLAPSVKMGYRYQRDLTLHQMQDLLSAADSMQPSSQAAPQKNSDVRQGLRSFADRYASLSGLLVR